MSHPLNNSSAQPPPAPQIPRRKIIPTSPKSHKRASQPTTNGNPDKIDGLTRELYALIGDNAPSLAQVKEELALAGNGRKRWAGKEERGKTGVRWRLTPFQPPNRSSPLTLSHWKPLPSTSIVPPASSSSSSIVQAEEDQTFAKLGKEGQGPSVMSYTSVEYDLWLTDEKWTPHETSYLFSLLKEYDLRFLIIADRYAYLPPGGTSGQDVNVFTKSKKGGKNGLALGSLGSAGTGTGATAGPGSRRSVRAGGRGSRQQTPSTSSTPITNVTNTSTTNPPAAPVRETDVKRRSIEEIKDRYYTVCRRLIRNRPALDEAVKERMVRAFDYDLHREGQRKTHLSTQFNLPRSLMLESESLYLSLKRMEQTDRRYKSDRLELMRTMGGLESGVLLPGNKDDPQGTRAFGKGEGLGIGLMRGTDGSVVNTGEKVKKRKRGDEEEGGLGGVGAGTGGAGVGVGQGEEREREREEKKEKREEKREKVDPVHDEKHNITHLPTLPQTHPTRPTYTPAHLRSTRLPPGSTKPAVIQSKTTSLLSTLGINTARLIMPTEKNVELLQKVVAVGEGVVELKRVCDRVTVEVEALRVQREMMIKAYRGSGGGAGTGASTAGVGVASPEQAQEKEKEKEETEEEVELINSTPQ